MQDRIKIALPTTMRRKGRWIVRPRKGVRPIDRHRASGQDQGRETR